MVSTKTTTLGNDRKIKVMRFIAKVFVVGSRK